MLARMDEAPRTGGDMLAATVHVPEHVVYRAFPSETVVLNLTTGKYYGVNATGGRMLDVLREVGDLRQAAARLAEEYDAPLSEVERDLSEFSARLAERELIEVEAPAGR
jgi:hypothetical protein